MKFSVLCALAAFLPCSAVARVTMPSVLADGMVLQRDQPLRIWGMAAPAESVTVRFQSASAGTTADRLGRWQVMLPAFPAGGPFTLEVEGANRIALRDILVGDVWLASGQSNMEFQVKNVTGAAAELARAAHPNIRLFHVAKAASEYPRDDVKAKTWTPVTPDSVQDFSAVAYFFAVELQRTQTIPIGLIEADWGGTPVESWTSLRAMADDASLMSIFSARAEVAEQQAGSLLSLRAEETAVAEARAAGRPAPKFPFHPDFAAWSPGALFNGMIAPLVPYRIKGALWYQGESNAGADRVGTYRRQFETMIRDWRARWGQGDFPFYFVQLANFKTGAKWPELRQAQTQTLALRNTGMALAIDIGDPDDIHPKNKQEVGRRLALIARANTYGEPVEFSGPTLSSSIPQSGSLRLLFNHAQGLQGSAGFEISDDGQHWSKAEAKVDGSAVILSNASVPKPVHARYDWANNPNGDIRNADNLPAGPFTTLP